MAETVADFGIYITLLALQVLVVIDLHGSTFDLGLISTARWLPYVLFGLVAGVVVDRLHRRTVLVATHALLSLLLAVICTMAALGVLDIGWLGFLIMLFGTVSLFNDASYQSILPQLVPQSLLIRANVRLEQSDAVARVSGPTIAGALIAWIGAPFALLVDAVGHLFSAFMNASLPSAATAAPKSDARTQVMEGLRWVYSHQQLRALALNTNAWFLCNAVVGTILTPFALTDLGFSTMTLGVVLSAAGVGALLGTNAVRPCRAAMGHRQGDRFCT
jgi:MFS family permease